MLLLWAGGLAAQERPERARDIGIALDGTPGPLDAITDVAGVEVGHTTIIRGEGTLKEGSGPVRTGVTAIFPRGRRNLAPVFAGWFNLNGNGEMTGTAWIDDYALLLYPVMLTNTNSVGTVRDAVIEWGRPRIVNDAFNCCLPGSGRDLGRRAERHLRLPRDQAARVRRPRRAPPAGRCPKGTWAAGPA